MRDLVQQDGEGGYRADRRPNQERRPHGQAVGEIMDEVGCQVEVTRHLDVCNEKMKPSMIRLCKFMSEMNELEPPNPACFRTESGPYIDMAVIKEHLIFRGGG